MGWWGSENTSSESGEWVKTTSDLGNNLFDLIGLRNMVLGMVELSNIVSPDMLVVHNIMSENILSDIVVAGVGELENTDLTTSNCDKQSSNFWIEQSLNFWIKPAAMLNH